jgi:hypothetical protein
VATTTYKTASGITCLLCEAANPPGGVLCKECNAPLSLVHDIATQKRKPQVVSILGDSNAGKTVYLGFLLDMLSQRARNFEAVPKGAFSVDLQQRVISYMAYRMFPPKTPMETNEWSWAYYQVRRGGDSPDWVDLVMPDMAGEAIAAEVTSPTTFKVIRNLLSMSAGMLLLVDAALAGAGSPQPDFFSMKMLSYLDGLFNRNKKGLIEVPIAVILAKADYFPECFDDPRRFAEANLNRFWNMCQSRFARVAFFPSSVVGSLAYATSDEDEHVRPVPLHTALRGVLEPFEWIMQQM